MLPLKLDGNVRLWLNGQETEVTQAGKQKINDMLEAMFI
jgi:hypothetical protein